jgi:hypothetical protein
MLNGPRGGKQTDRQVQIEIGIQWPKGVDMTNLQQILAITIPSLLILLGIFQDNAGFNRIEARFNSVEARLTTMEGDLRQFYRDLGRHEADIVNIKERNRS